LSPLRWEYTAEPDGERVAVLADACSVSLPIARLLLSRKLDTPDKVRRFLDPTLDDLTDPFEIAGMDGVVDRIAIALRERERMLVYGDYDVDGITSTALMYQVLNRLGAEVDYYIPNRLIEGYGLSPDGIDQAVTRGIRLILTVDCGITAVDEIEYARRKGIEVLVADHHERGTILPDAIGIINPKLNPNGSPVDHLAAVGVAFKLAQALYRRLGQDESDLYEHLDLVALGTSADIVPLIGENRILTRFGLTQIERTGKPGLKSLCFVAGLIGRSMSTGQILFVLAPRINAAGRLGDAQAAVRLLSTRDDNVAGQIAHRLEEDNRKRKTLDEQTLKHALLQIEQTVDLNRDRAIVLASAGWHQGVIGIVASRLVERFHLPTVMIAIEDLEGRASARSIPAFDLYDAFRACEDLLLRYGGHKYAAGMSISRERIPAFAERFKRVAAERLMGEDLIPTLSIDARLDPADLSEEFMDSLEQFAPFGPQNMRPIFVAPSLEMTETPHIVGRSHLKFRARAGNRSLECIGFGMGERISELRGHTGRIDLAYIPERNEWRGERRLQLRVRDFQLV